MRNLLILLFMFPILAFAHTKEKNWGYIYGYPPHSEETLECLEECTEETDYYENRDTQVLVGCYVDKCGCYIEEETMDLHCYNDYPKEPKDE